VSGKNILFRKRKTNVEEVIGSRKYKKKKEEEME
jgi:hypothetical protein